MQRFIFLGLKNLIFGVTHSMLLNQNIAQLLILMFSKIILLKLSVKFQNIFYHSFLKILTFTYFLSAIGIDLLLILSQTNLLQKISK